MAAVPPGLIRKGFLKEAREDMVCGDEPGPRRAVVPLGVRRKALSRFLNRGQAPFTAYTMGWERELLEK